MHAWKAGLAQRRQDAEGEGGGTAKVFGGHRWIGFGLEGRGDAEDAKVRRGERQHLSLSSRSLCASASLREISSRGLWGVLDRRFRYRAACPFPWNTKEMGVTESPVFFTCRVITGLRVSWVARTRVTSGLEGGENHEGGEGHEAAPLRVLRGLRGFAPTDEPTIMVASLPKIAATSGGHGRPVLPFPPPAHGAGRERSASATAARARSPTAVSSSFIVRTRAPWIRFRHTRWPSRRS